MEKHSKLFVFILFVLFILALVGSLTLGPSETSPLIFMKALGSNLNAPLGSFFENLIHATPEEVETAKAIFWNVRIPRTLLVAMVGALLASAGVLTQGLFRNPLASPSLLGMEAGASLAGSLTLFYLADIWAWYTLPLFAILGALGVTVLMVFWARSSQGIGALLLTGVALGSFFTAGSSFLISLNSQDYNKSAMVMRWLLGGFSGRGLEHIPMALIPGILGFLIIWPFLPRLDLLALGEDTAQSLGGKVQSLKWQVVLVVGLWIGGAVAVSGSIPFVGLIVPHLGRKILGPGTKALVLGSSVIGMTLTLFADILGRILLAPQEIEVGITMALIGSPAFLWILHQSSRSNPGVKKRANR